MICQIRVLHFSQAIFLRSIFCYYIDMNGRFILIIGPSGVGKSAILRHLRSAHPNYVFPKSATTRPPREGEGSDLYHFISDAEFTQWLHEGKFLEWAQVHHGARYGTLMDEIVPAIEAGKIVIREVDVQGFLAMKQHPLFIKGGRYPLKTIFILPENEGQLVRQITKRAPISEEELDRRLQSVRRELACAPETDVQIVNRDGALDATIARVEEEIEG
jgi:guanylate kinase